MGTVYVLINCDLGYEEEIIGKLKNISGVKEAQGTFGAYDILAKIELLIWVLGASLLVFDS